MTRKITYILLSILILSSCSRGSIVIVYENSSDLTMQLEVTLNGEVQDTIIIPSIEKQKVQISIRKEYSSLSVNKFQFRELSSNVRISKSIERTRDELSFVILGHNDRSGKFKLDTISYNYLPDVK